jgi:cytochrome c
MLASGIVWDHTTLRAFLANPAARVPGTSMVSRGTGGAANLDALLFYLEQLSAFAARELQ